MFRSVELSREYARIIRDIEPVSVQAAYDEMKSLTAEAIVAVTTLDAADLGVDLVRSGMDAPAPDAHSSLARPPIGLDELRARRALHPRSGNVVRLPRSPEAC